jgi:hypothetical protein
MKLSINTPPTKTRNRKGKLKQFITTNPPLQKILTGILHKEEEDKCSH